MPAKQTPVSLTQASEAAAVLDLIIEENSAVASYNCPLCGSEIHSERISDDGKSLDHDPACQYADYVTRYYPQYKDQS